MKIGVLGAGQLGRMLALAGYPLANRFRFLDTTGNPSAGIGEVMIDTDQKHIQSFLEDVDLVTYEFEHLPVSLVQAIEAERPVYPGSEAIRVCQNRAEEKALFDRLGIPTPAYRLVDSAEALEAAAKELGTPVVAKSITEGYDGKGQAVLKQPSDAADAWSRINHPRLIVESFVDFVREVSIIAVRGRDGQVVFYPMAENVHVDGILRYSLAPMPNLDDSVQHTADEYIRALLDELDYVGVLTLELFQCADGSLLANEMAPRVHNSGHWTMDGAVTSQFENHLRAIQGLPLGDTSARAPTCMVNVIGREPDPSQVLAMPDAHLHRYDKSERAGRKLGHINLVAADHATLLDRVRQCAALVPDAPEVRFSFED
ncbi:5-(carboxyamino)imidazole ribonucleotide synthase [Halomonas denitrificans]|uniref:5-(carboxyamino)imidazole ribonucleotide synthase n=1 Tax=Halomonas TaxID=2745 RepID=UPI001A8CB558|nr:MULTISPECIES: 5-(carboxyamino)imidazole ribonucleotide synthase [Halomonas]MED5296925.1 5-(carboxyamino)imidazole ribonucleotide synthase [Pseudomonadota bacterium]MBN8411645.1 5-(carboxyamino)imidazole ribonucleotide synthase [Halomonas litopenaei]MBY5927991.1 5-(carboxyamino)imidazole ribonucleotide synthase [Halomonas sp. DP8Y7-3]MBY5982960.1 5-(carboxyamino)imidazole ribonucleotide synthase [Halomonas sp. DP5Y7-2]MBY6029035.1 5-(carboxyamino)imidazole ribonucleotide synthase [Halomonas 